MLTSISHARLRVQRAPGIPCALFVEGSCWQSSGVFTPRECNWLFETSNRNPPLSSRTSERKQARSGTHTPRLLIGHKCQIRFTTTNIGGYGFLLSQERQREIIATCAWIASPALAMTNATSPRLRGEVGDGAKQSLRVRGTIRKYEPVESPPHPLARCSRPLPARGAR